MATESHLTILIGKNCFTQFSTRMAAWLLLIFFIRLHNRNWFYTFHTRIIQNRCLKNVIHQIVDKNEWLLLSASFAAKFELVFVLTLEKAFS